SGAPFGVVTSYGKGKVIAIGDSAVFDDGEAKDGEILHNVFNSIMFDFKQFGLNIFCYLSEKEFIQFEHIIPWNKIPEKNGFIIDISKANYGADNFLAFAERLSKSGFTPYFNTEPLTENLIKNSDFILICEPGLKYSDSELNILRKFPDLKKIFVSYSRFNSLDKPYINELVKLLTNTQMKFSNNQILDSANSIRGRAWTFLAHTEEFSSIVFSTCSIENIKKSDFIKLYSSSTSFSDGPTDIKKPPYPIITVSSDKKTMLAGFSVFTDYSYRESRYYSNNYHNVLHTTENFVEYLIDFMRNH
ncbi:MAG: hypothetical protein WC002_06135, partial [Candidatus Muiribacteriota bacterium]